MRKTTAAASSTFVAALAAVTLATGAAQASPSRTTTPVLLGSLQLSKTDSTGTTTTASLNCVRGINVDGVVYVDGNGTVTDPTAACQELDAVGGDFTKLDVHPTWMPTAQNAPVSVTATGNWGSTSVDYAQTFGNSSLLAKTTGDVFGF